MPCWTGESLPFFKNSILVLLQLLISKKCFFLAHRIWLLCMYASSTCNPTEKCWEGKKKHRQLSSLCIDTATLCSLSMWTLGTAVMCWRLVRLKHFKMFLWDFSLITKQIFYIMKLTPSYVLYHLIRFIRLTRFVKCLDWVRTNVYFCSLSPWNCLFCCCIGEYCSKLFTSQCSLAYRRIWQHWLLFCWLTGEK